MYAFWAWHRASAQGTNTSGSRTWTQNVPGGRCDCPWDTFSAHLSSPSMSCSSQSFSCDPSCFSHHCSLLITLAWLFPGWDAAVWTEPTRALGEFRGLPRRYSQKPLGDYMEDKADFRDTADTDEIHLWGQKER